jgi:hypothetical protein
MKSVATLFAFLLATTGCGKRLDPSFEGTIAIHKTFSSGGAVDRTTEFKNGKVRMQGTSSEFPSSWQFYAIIDTRLREVVVVTDKDKTYTKATYAMMFGMHPEDKPPKRTATDKWSSSTVAGYVCSNWEVHTGYGPREEVCATPFVDLAVDRVGPGREDGATGLPDLALFPLRTVTFDSTGTEIRREEVVRIERRAIDDARFAIPPGYTELKERPH